MLSIEGIRLKIRNKVYIPLICRSRGKKLNNTDFTIISNNRWDGTVYEAYNLPKELPTVGMFFMAEDYVTFLSDLEGYISGTLEFIKPEESRWKDTPQISGDRRSGSRPVGSPSNGKSHIETFSLRYYSEKETKDKWEQRCKRINWDRLLIRFNDQNGCVVKNIYGFMNFPFRHRLFFTCKKWPGISGGGGLLYGSSQNMIL